MGSINNIFAVDFFLFFISKSLTRILIYPCCHSKSKEIIYFSHLLCITKCKILVGCNKNSALSCKSIKIHRQSCHKRLTFPCIHLTQISLMHSNCPKNLNIIRSFSKNSSISLAHNCIRLWEYIICRFSFLKTLFEYISHISKLIIRKRIILFLVASDLLKNFIKL